MKYLPSIVTAEYVRGYIIKVKFDDGTQKSVDFSQWFNGPVFEPIKDVNNFQQFFVEAGAVAWPYGVDIAPEAVYSAEDVQKAA
jgi:hypothetical protein